MAKKTPVAAKKEQLRRKQLDKTIELLTSSDMGSAKPAYLTDLAAEISKVFRGPQGLARRLYLQYLKAPDGSAQRMKILDMVFTIISKDSQMNGMGNSTDLGDMTEEEMQSEVAGIIDGASQVDPGDPCDPDFRERAIEQVDKAENEDPEVAELDKEIELMEAGEQDRGSTLGDLIKKLKQHAGDDVEE